MPVFTPQQINFMQNLLSQGNECEVIFYLEDVHYLTSFEAEQYVHSLKSKADSANLKRISATSHSESIPQFKAIHVNHDDQQVIVFTADERALVVDENHPEWDNVITRFGRGQQFDTKHAFIKSIHQDSKANRSIDTHKDQSVDLRQLNHLKTFLILLFVGSIATTWLLAIFLLD